MILNGSWCNRLWGLVCGWNWFRIMAVAGYTVRCSANLDRTFITYESLHKQNIFTFRSPKPSGLHIPLVCPWPRPSVFHEFGHEAPMNIAGQDCPWTLLSYWWPVQFPLALNRHFECTVLHTKHCDWCDVYTVRCFGLVICINRSSFSDFYDTSDLLMNLLLYLLFCFHILGSLTSSDSELNPKLWILRRLAGLLGKGIGLSHDLYPHRIMQHSHWQTGCAI